MWYQNVQLFKKFSGINKAIRKSIQQIDENIERASEPEIIFYCRKR